MQLGGFGFGLPITYFEACGLNIVDVTLDIAPSDSRASDFIEPFMDPFVASFLHRLATGELDKFPSILIMRESPGAIHAYHYGKELARKGVVPKTAPELIVINLIGATTPAVAEYNSAEIKFLRSKLGLDGKPSQPNDPMFRNDGFEMLKREQEKGNLSGADAFEMRARLSKTGGVGFEVPDRSIKGTHRRFALLGSPFGNSRLHQHIDKSGLLLFDQQGWDQTFAMRGDTADAAISAMAANPFAGRQPRETYVQNILSELLRLEITDIVWQVDQHDDIWGWLMPALRDAVQSAGIRFCDLGFLPRWPTNADIMQVQERLAP